MKTHLLRGFLLTILAVSGCGTSDRDAAPSPKPAKPGDVPVKPAITTLYSESVAVPPKAIVQFPLTLEKPAVLSIDLTIRTDTPADVYVMDPVEAANYMAVQTSWSGGEFHHLPEMYRIRARDFRERKVVAAGEYALVIRNRAGDAMDAGLLATAGPPPENAIPLKLPAPLAGNRGGEGPGRYELALTSYTVIGKKNNGGAWDSDDSAPDPEFQLLFDETDGVEQPSHVKTGENQNRPASRGPEVEKWEFYWNGARETTVGLPGFRHDPIRPDRRGGRGPEELRRTPVRLRAMDGARRHGRPDEEGGLREHGRDDRVAPDRRPAPGVCGTLRFPTPDP